MSCKMIDALIEKHQDENALWHTMRGNFGEEYPTSPYTHPAFSPAGTVLRERNNQRLLELLARIKEKHEANERAKKSRK
jgi:hypothetical protein